jgi:hypothetical protein
MVDVARGLPEDPLLERILREFRRTRLEIAALSGRLSHGLGAAVRAVIAELSGEQLGRAERLVLTDAAGDVLGVPGARLEYDLFLSDGTAYVVEVTTHLKPNDVLAFHRKVAFASQALGRPLRKVMIAASMEERAEPLLRRLEIIAIVRSRLRSDA